MKVTMGYQRTEEWPRFWLGTMEQARADPDCIEKDLVIIEDGRLPDRYDPEGVLVTWGEIQGRRKFLKFRALAKFWKIFLDLAVYDFEGKFSRKGDVVHLAKIFAKSRKM